MNFHYYIRWFIGMLFLLLAMLALSPKSKACSEGHQIIWCGDPPLEPDPVIKRIRTVRRYSV